MLLKVLAPKINNKAQKDPGWQMANY